MESIFQIKINENKLQKIITDLVREQSRNGEEIKNLNKMIADKEQECLNRQTLIEQKFEQKCEELGENNKQISETSSAYFENLRGSIDKMYRQMESIPSKLFSLEEQISKVEKLSEESKDKIFDHQNYNYEKWVTMNEKLERVENNCFNENYGVISKVKRLEKVVEGNASILAFFKDHDIINFFEHLIDKEWNKKGTIMKDQSTYFQNFESKDEKSRKFKELKKSLSQAKNKITFMENEHADILNEMTKREKGIKEETNMHYAVLSSKVKDIEIKLNEKQENNPIQTEKTLHPTANFKERTRKVGKTTFDDGSLFLSKKDIFDESEIIGERLFEEIKKVKNSMEENQKNFTEKLNKVHENSWIHENKIKGFKSSIDKIKADISEISDSVKLNTHYRQFNDKENVNSKLVGGFITQFRNMEDNIQEQMKDRIGSKDFYKNVNSVNERIKIIQEQIETKANKDETRKAFEFIEEKVKEIVTLIADMQNFNRKTAGRKMIFQCLSCDENFFEENNSPVESVQPATSRDPLHKTQSNFILRQKGGDKLKKNKIIKGNLEE